MATPDVSRPQLYLSISRLGRLIAAAGLSWVLGLSAASAAPAVSCAACLVVDSEGDVLWARKARIPRPNASTTKMLTALLVARVTAPSEKVVVSRTAAGVGGGGLDLLEGEVYSVDELIHALLLSSSNEAAVALAEHAAGSEAAFVQDMNRFARRLGARETHFVNAHGLDAPGHASSARDLALIAERLLEDSLLGPVVRTPRFVIRRGERRVLVENRNPLLETYRGAIGVKTGQTLGAGDVLVAAAHRGRHTIIAVAMGSDDAGRDGAALLDYGFARLRRLARQTTVVSLDPAAAVAEVVFDSAGATQIKPATRLEEQLTGGDFEVMFSPLPDLELPLRSGERVGILRIVAAGEAVAVVDAVAAADVDADSGSWLMHLFAALIRFGGAVLPVVRS